MGAEDGKKAEVVDLGERKVSDCSINELLGALLYAMDRRRTEGNPRLAELTVEEFTGKMMEVFRSRAWAGAAEETRVAEQVLTDWQGLLKIHAVAQPFRVASVEEADQMAAHLKDTFTRGQWKGAFVIAVGMVHPDKTYAPYTPSPLPTQPVHVDPRRQGQG